MSVEREALNWGCAVVNRLRKVTQEEFDTVYRDVVKGITEEEFKRYKVRFRELLTAQAHVACALDATAGSSPANFSKALGESKLPSAIEVVNSWKAVTPYCPPA